MNQPDGTSDKTSASGARGMGGSINNPKPINFPTHYQWLAKVATLMYGPWHKDGHHSLVTFKRVLSKYNEDMIFDE